MTISGIPPEIVEYIIGFLPPKERYLAATAVRSTYIRDKTILVLGSMDTASERGNVELLQWWLNNGEEPEYSHWAMDKASEKGQIPVLEWWKQSGLLLKFTSFATTSASENGHVHVLDWWLKSGLDMRWCCWAMEYATEKNQIAVLEWWKHSGLPLIFFTDRGKMRAKGYYQERKGPRGNRRTRDWWKKNADMRPYSTDIQVVLRLGGDQTCGLSTILWD